MLQMISTDGVANANANDSCCRFHTKPTKDTTKKGGGETGKQEGQTQLCGEGLRRLYVLAISERLLLCGQNLSRSAHKKTALCTELRNSNGRRFHSVPTAGSTGSSGSTAASGGGGADPFQLEMACERAHRSYGKSPQLVFRAGAHVSQLLTPPKSFDGDSFRIFVCTLDSKR